MIIAVNVDQWCHQRRFGDATEAAGRWASAAARSSAPIAGGSAGRLARGWRQLLDQLWNERDHPVCKVVGGRDEPRWRFVAMLCLPDKVDRHEMGIGRIVGDDADAVSRS